MAVRGETSAGATWAIVAGKPSKLLVQRGKRWHPPESKLLQLLFGLTLVPGALQSCYYCQLPALASTTEVRTSPAPRAMQGGSGQAGATNPQVGLDVGPGPELTPKTCEMIEKCLVLWKTRSQLPPPQSLRMFHCWCHQHRVAPSPPQCSCTWLAVPHPALLGIAL